MGCHYVALAIVSDGLVNSSRSQKLYCTKNVYPDILLLNSNNSYCELFCNFCNKAHFNDKFLNH